MSEVKLKNCPFCGSKPTIARSSLNESYAYADRVVYCCAGCGVSCGAVGDYSKPGYADNSTVEARAFEEWNKRATFYCGPEPSVVSALQEDLYQAKGARDAEMMSGIRLQQRLTVAEKRIGELEGLLQMFVDNSDDKDVVELSEHALKAADDCAPIDDKWEK